MREKKCWYVFNVNLQMLKKNNREILKNTRVKEETNKRVRGFDPV
jgi:hypothetical protein